MEPQKLGGTENWYCVNMWTDLWDNQVVYTKSIVYGIVHLLYRVANRMMYAHGKDM